MALDITSNFAAGVARQNLTVSDRQASTSLAKLSSGRRVFAARIDAASLAIGSRLNADVEALKQAESNAVQAVSLPRTTEGAFDATSEILTRLNTLTVQAASGQLSDGDRAAINTEFNELRAEIDRIAGSTRINGHPLDEPLSLDFKVGAGGTDDTISISLDPPTAASLGLNSLSIDTKAGAEAAGGALSEAIDKIADRRALIGSTQNRLAFAESNLAVAVENKEAARGSLMDLNVAQESTQLALSQTLTKAGLELLREANRGPGRLIDLLA